jgi:serine phosphatase RsbU (regulator of sigma subunit)
MLPDMSGEEVLRRIRAHPALRHVPVVMVSALDEMETAVRCIEIGAEDFLTKPFNPVLLKARIGACLEKKRYRDREQQYARSLERDLDIGRKIQADFFPASLPEMPGWTIEARFRSARQVAGDFYDAFPLRGGTVALVVGDVCDKGVGAALFMALFRSLIRAVAGLSLGGVEPDAAGLILRAVQVTNDYIARVHDETNMFSTLFIGALDPATGRLDYVNAGHESALVARAGGAIEELGPKGPAVGMMPDVAFGTGSTTLGAADALLIFTDGLTEARDRTGVEFGEGRIRELLAMRGATAQAMLDRIYGAVRSHVEHAEPTDDLTLLGVMREG